MKVLIPILLLISLRIGAQSISVQYHKKIVVTDRPVFNTEEDWMLEIDNQVSLFRPIGKIRDTSWTKKYETMGEQYQAPVTHFYNYEIYYTNLKSNTKITVHHFGGKDYRVEGPLTPMYWEIKDKFRTILGYKCQLAISEKYGYPIEVWFTKEIPVSAAPNDLLGLPGLILEYQILFSHVIAEKVEFDKKMSINPPNWGKRCMDQEYQEIVNEAFKYPEGTTIIDTKNEDGTITTRWIEVEISKPKTKTKTEQ